VGVQRSCAAPLRPAAQRSAAEVSGGAGRSCATPLQQLLARAAGSAWLAPGCARPAAPAEQSTATATATAPPATDPPQQALRPPPPPPRRTLLHAGRAPLAAAHLARLPPERAEALVVAAAREILDSAPALDAPAVSEARRCLELAPQSDLAAAELALVSALGQLQRQGLALLPAEVRQMGDRLLVVDRLLAARPDAYERQEQVRLLAAGSAVRSC
jgi:hypothetical protein